MIDFQVPGRLAPRLSEPGVLSRKVLVLLAVLAGLLIAASPPTYAQQASYDVLIRGGQVIDGTGRPAVDADVGIRDDTIAAVGDLSNAAAERTIDASGLVVAPGFIDGHSHAAGGLSDSARSAARPLLAQGITTVVVNPDGGGPADLTEQREKFRRHGLGVNVFQLVPYGAVRTEVMDEQDRPPTPAEQKELRARVEREMATGAIGLSTGLFYAPGTYAKTQEIVDAAQVASRHGGVYQSHVRDEGGYSVGVLAANRELIEIARRADLPAIHTHIKAFGPREQGLSDELVSQIQDARDEGLSVFADLYPYRAAGGSVAGILVPREELAGGLDTLRAEIKDDPSARRRVLDGIRESIQLEGGPSSILLRDVPEAPELEGKTLQEAAESRNTEPASLALDLLLRGRTGYVVFGMKEQDIETFLRQPWTMVASDGGLSKDQLPHPRSYGTFPKVIETYVQERGVLGLEEAIWRMTSLYREAYPIQERGLLEEGRKADVVIFDPDRVRAPSSYLKPRQLSEGMVHVLVNGRLAIRDGEFAERRAGRVLDRATEAR
ncbi:MAG: amidohydrolase family protein [Salinibacter sp.]|uniref:N-acyl-D-amino-acid deacylase family protein n=1 Tax=Salinibacter sp. TaxID=2065818 RepID=UPI002FC29BF4